VDSVTIQFHGGAVDREGSLGLCEEIFLAFWFSPQYRDGRDFW
jgi:hypothetical protein